MIKISVITKIEDLEDSKNNIIVVADVVFENKKDIKRGCEKMIIDNAAQTFKTLRNIADPNYKPMDGEQLKAFLKLMSHS